MAGALLLRRLVTVGQSLKRFHMPELSVFGINAQRAWTSIHVVVCHRLMQAMVSVETSNRSSDPRGIP